MPKFFGFQFGDDAKKTPPTPPPTTPQPTTPPTKPKEPEKKHGLTEYSGMSVTERRMKELGLKDGGKVRGPGTGVSDSIRTQLPAGAYVMPADTTEKVGERALSQMGRPVDVRLSNGEYVMPPEQVMAVGEQTLSRIKDATHVPAQAQAQGFRPELFFADGGTVKPTKPKDAPTPPPPPKPEEKKQNALSGYLGMSATERRMKELGLKDGGIVDDDARVKAGKASISDTVNVLNQSGLDTRDALNRGQYGEAAGSVMRGTAAAIPAIAHDAHRLITKPLTDAADTMAGVTGSVARSVGSEMMNQGQGFARGFLGLGAGRESAPPPAAPKKPASQVTASQMLAQQGDDFASAPETMPITQPADGSAPPPPASQRQASSSVTPSGDTIYDESNGIAKYRGANGEMAFSNIRPEDRGGIAGFQPGRSAPSSDATGGYLKAAEIYNSMRERPGGSQINIVPDSSAREWNQAMDRRAMMDAIGTPHAGAQGGQLTAAQVRAMTDLSKNDADIADRMAGRVMESQTRMEDTRMREEGANERADKQGQYTTSATEMREKGANARAEREYALNERKVRGEEEARGFTTRAAQRLESLHEQYDKAKPEDRSAIAQQILELSGKDQPNRFTVVPGGQAFNQDGMPYTLPSQVLNNQTGQFMQQPAQQSQPTGKGSGTFEKGKIYTDAHGNRARYDGTGFVPVQ